MERIETRVEHSFKARSACELFGCSVHNYTFILDQHGKLLSPNTEYEDFLSLPKESIRRILVTCHELCEISFLMASGEVYSWTLSKNRSEKRLKVEESELSSNLKQIGAGIHYIAKAAHDSIYLFSENECKQYKYGSSRVVNLGGLNSKVTCHCFYQDLDSKFADFFSIKAEGLIYGTSQGQILYRGPSDEAYTKDVRLLAFESQEEEVKYIEFVERDQTCYFLVAGSLGTILMYYKRTEEEEVDFKQFNITPSVVSMDRIQNTTDYIVCDISGKVHLLRYVNNEKEIELEWIPFDALQQVSKLRIIDSSTLEVLTCSSEYRKVKYDTQSVLVEDDPEAIHALIKEALEELALSESSLAETEREEQSLTQKLGSVNRTVYALQSIDSRRKKNVCNSLEETGFEFTLCPVVKKLSVANSGLHPACYFRVCIRTLKFLQLESWELVLDLFSERDLAGKTLRIPIIGFESHYEQGIERYSLWDREIPMDAVELPLKVTCSLEMVSEVSLRFPIGEMRVDDVHFAVPCSDNLIQAIQRRGLEDVSNELIGSYRLQMLLDKTGKYPFARFLRKQDSQQIPRRIDYNKTIHIRCTVSSLTNEQYCSVLPKLLQEGRSDDETRQIIPHAEIAYFTLVSFPASPIILKLSKISEGEINLTLQCTHPPALFKAEHAILTRLSHYHIKEEGPSPFLKEKLQSLENSIIDLHEAYQNDGEGTAQDDERAWSESMELAIEKLYNIYSEFAIGQFQRFLNYFVVPVTAIAVVGAAVRSQARPAKAHTRFMKSDYQTRQNWRKVNDGLSVQDVGRSGGGV
ncbi:hypothetical protein BY458DRAFT_589697 [Sporodiniella umbellata]|nr:hypothetical protein BY458DRAFT_589697 [Sporodiniella umbellata]